MYWPSWAQNSLHMKSFIFCCFSAVHNSKDCQACMRDRISTRSCDTGRLSEVSGFESVLVYNLGQILYRGNHRTDARGAWCTSYRNPACMIMCLLFMCVVTPGCVSCAACASYQAPWVFLICCTCMVCVVVGHEHGATLWIFPHFQGFQAA